MATTDDPMDGLADDPTGLAAKALVAAVAAMFPGLQPTDDRYKETCALTYVGLRAAYPVFAEAIRAEVAREARP